MIENPTNIVAPKSVTQGDVSPDQTLEAVALAGAAAIQRLIAERDSYYQRMSNQQRDLVALRAINEDLQHRIALIRERYVGVGRIILAQLEQFDQATREAMSPRSAPSNDANVLALAERFKPKNSAC